LSVQATHTSRETIRACACIRWSQRPELVVVLSYAVGQSARDEEGDSKKIG